MAKDGFFFLKGAIFLKLLDFQCSAVRFLSEEGLEIVQTPIFVKKPALRRVRKFGLAPEKAESEFWRKYLSDEFLGKCEKI